MARCTGCPSVATNSCNVTQPEFLSNCFITEYCTFGLWSGVDSDKAYWCNYNKVLSTFATESRLGSLLDARKLHNSTFIVHRFYKIPRIPQSTIPRREHQKTNPRIWWFGYSTKLECQYNPCNGQRHKDSKRTLKPRILWSSSMTPS